MRASYALVPLALEEIVSQDGFTHMATVSSNDLTTTANNTAQALIVAPIQPGQILLVEMRLRTAFRAVGDNANNSTTLSVGDDGSATSLLAATQVNANNGAPVPVARGALSAPYAALSHIVVTLNSMAAKNLNALNQGEAQLFFKIVDFGPLGNLKGATASTK